VGINVCVAVAVLVMDGVDVADGLGVWVDVGTGVSVGVDVGSAVAVLVGVGVADGLGVLVEIAICTFSPATITRSSISSRSA
jgi:hypothetical protein